MKKTMSFVVIWSILLSLVWCVAYAEGEALRVPSTIYKPSSGTAYLQAKMLGCTDVVYHVEGEGGLAIDAQTGVITIDEDTVIGDYTIKAVSGTDESVLAQKIVTVQEPINHVFAENQPWGWSGGSVEYNESKAFYQIKPTASNNRLRLNKNFGITSEDGGSFTIEYDLYGNNASLMRMVGGHKSDGTNGAFWPSGIKIPAAETEDGWRNVRLEVDFDRGIYQYYIDGVYQAQGSIHTSESSSQMEKEIIGLILDCGDANARIANIRLYSGKRIQLLLEHEQMFIPAEGKVSTNQLGVLGIHNAEIYCQNLGVAIDENNVLTVSNEAIPGTVDIEIYQNEVCVGKDSMDIKKLGVNESWQHWTSNSIDAYERKYLIETENDQEYITLTENISGDNRLRYGISGASGWTQGLQGRIIMEGTFRFRPGLSDAKGSHYNGRIAISDAQTGAFAFSHYLSESEDWVNVRVVLDTEKHTAALFIDGVLQEVEPVLDLTSIGSLVFGVDVQKLNVYYVNGLAAPQAGLLQMTTAVKGLTPQGTYVFFSENGSSEEGTIVQYFISDSMDGEFELIDNNTVFTEQDCGKYIKLAVTPASGTNIGQTYYSNAVKIVRAKIDGLTFTEDEQAMYITAVQTVSDPMDETFVYLAVYDQERNKLEQCYEISSNTVYPITVPKNQSIKVFIWDSMLMPLCETYTQ